MNNITNANALVAKGATGDASSFNSSLDEILKQLSVNRQHLDLFFSLYIKTLDRLLGEDVARAVDNSVVNATWVKGSAGGWLKALSTISQSSSSDSLKASVPPAQHLLGRGINATYMDSLPFPLCAILQKFLPGSNMFEILSRIQGGCEIKLNLLPTKLHMFIANHSLYPYVQAKYHQYIFLALLKYNLQTSNQRNHVTHKNALLLDPTEYFFVCLLRYPTLSNTHVSSDRSVVDLLQNRGITSWIRGTPYLVLLQEYLRVYVPIAVADSAGRDAGDMRAQEQVQEAQQRAHQELFLHLAVAFWIDAALVLKSDHSKLGVLRKQLSGGPQYATDSAVHGGAFVTERAHPSPTELELLDTSSMRWTIGSMQCTYLLLLRVLADPQLRYRVEDAADAVDTSYGATPGVGRRTPAGAHGGGAAQAVAQPAWQLLQTPVFDMLRTIFVKGDGNGVDPQIIGLAVETWLLWIQPWNALAILNSPTGVLPTRSGNLAGYTEEWRPYVAANLHFYSTLLACFLKYVARGQLSVNDADGLRLLSTLERVLQVFSPALLRCVDELSGGFQAWFRTQHPHHRRSGAGTAPRGGMQDTLLLLRSTLRGTPAPAAGSYTRQAPHTEGYSPGTPEVVPASTSASAPATTPRGAEGAASTPARHRHVTTLLLHLIQIQHYRLFPDRKIDELDDCGITDVSVHAEQAGVMIVSQLNQMNENPVVEQDFLGKIMVAMRAQLGLPPEEAPRNKHSDRLVRAMNGVIQVVPEAAAGRDAGPGASGAAGGGQATGAGRGTLRAGAGGPETVRDEHSGKLTDYGRQLIVEGREKCHVQDILEPRALSRDPLELPMCSYEWKFLALLLIALSKRLNEHFHLPQDNQQIMCSWPMVLRRARQRQPAGDFLYPVKVAHQCFRFNLRFLARYRVFSTTAIMFLLGAYRLGLVSVITLLVLTSLLGFVAFQNGLALD